MGIARRWTVLFGFGCALAMQGQQHTSGMHEGDTTDGPAWSELNTSMEKMHVAMRSITPTGKSDTDFVRLMLPHHQAAIDMAKTQLLFGIDPQIRRLAQEIITDQQSEIELMQMWLKRHEPQK